MAQEELESTDLEGRAQRSLAPPPYLTEGGIEAELACLVENQGQRRDEGLGERG